MRIVMDQIDTEKITKDLNRRFSIHLPEFYKLCFAVVSGALCGWNMNVTRRIRRTAIRSVSENSRQFRCLMWI